MSTKHHILYNRRLWNTYEETKSLRENPQLIVPLQPELHKELHDNVSYVPSLNYYLARHTLRVFTDFEPTDDSIEAINNLQFSIREAAMHPRADYIEKEVARLAIHSLTLQKPFIMRSLSKGVDDERNDEQRR